MSALLVGCRCDLPEDAAAAFERAAGFHSLEVAALDGDDIDATFVVGNVYGVGVETYGVLRFQSEIGEQVRSWDCKNDDRVEPVADGFAIVVAQQDDSGAEVAWREEGGVERVTFVLSGGSSAYSFVPIGR